MPQTAARDQHEHPRRRSHQPSYLGRPGAWTVALDGQAMGLLTLGADHRVAGRAELSYQLTPSVWGNGIGREAAGAVLAWWSAAVRQPAPIVAVAQKANSASRRLLEAVGMAHMDTIVEHGAPQCVNLLPGPEGDSLPRLRHTPQAMEATERQRAKAVLATEEGSSLPTELSEVNLEALARQCPARHGVYGKICARKAGHRPDLHVGRTADRQWLCWTGNSDL
ncbi:GNAT family N-acetyltransferase [Streptomyces sp. NPDC002054]|uniref:GNAT family N-acetyltransferase n=1 Tax=Streptomyces sp. NPDC002054 TaxID=3154663 RepID=UPI00331C07C7